MSFQTVRFSGAASGNTGVLTTTGTFTAAITGNPDGSLAGTWSFVGTYQDGFYGAGGNETLSGTLTGTGPAGGPWTVNLQGTGASDQGLTLSYANGQYTLGVNVGFSADVVVNLGYDGNYIYHDAFAFQANLATSAPAPSGVPTDGNDTIAAPAGNATIDAGGGIDTVVFSDVRANYTVTNNGNGSFTVAHSTGDSTDTLVNVERLVFADAKVAIDINGHGGEAYRLYQAAFNRAPDLPGLGFQINALDSGLTLSQVAGNFIASPEFQATYGPNISDTDFITLLYQNVLHRAPDSGGLQFHLNELATGQSRADVLTHFSESPEDQANLLGTIHNGMTFVF